MESFLLVICLLIGGSVAIDFTTIGQKEIVDYIKNRADLIHGKRLSERNLQDLLSNAVFTGLEEEALIFAYGSTLDESDLKVDQLPARLAVLAASTDTSDSIPLKIVLTSDTLGSTNIAFGGLTTTKSSSSKSSIGNFVVDCVQQSSFDSTSLDGSITINLGGATDSHNLTLSKTIYLAAEVNVTSLGPNWERSSPQLTGEGKLLSMLSSKEGSLYVITYQSLIRETIKANEGDLFGGLKSEGKVLVVVSSNGIVSLSGRTISGKVEATWSNDAEEHVDTFLTLNGSKSRKFIMNVMPKSVTKNIVENWLFSVLKEGTTSNTLRYGRNDHGSRGHRDRNDNSRSNPWSRHGGHRGNRGGHRSNWKPSCSDGSTWPSWKPFWEFGYGFRFGWDSFDDLFDFDLDNDKGWRQNRDEPKPSTTNTKKPVKVTTKPKVPTTTKPIVEPVTTRKPELVTMIPTVHQEPTTIKEVEVTTVVPASPASELNQKLEEKPDLSEPALPNLPRGATISLWSTRII